MIDPRYRPLGFAWIALCVALALHVFDEASTGFLDVYNPTVVALRTKLGWWPMPTFPFGVWLWGLIAAILLALLLSGEVFRGARWIRIPAAVVAAVMLLNACGHTLFSILGHTVSSVTFSRPAPGFWSSPFMAAASVYLLVQLRRSRPRRFPSH